MRRSLILVLVAASLSGSVSACGKARSHAPATPAEAPVHAAVERAATVVDPPATDTTAANTTAANTQAATDTATANTRAAADVDPFASSFFGVDDGPVIHSLATSGFASAKKGSGGRSVGFKVTLADGTVGYFKPEQEFSGAHYYSELAAYYLDRELGFGRVAPAVGRVFAWSDLRPLLGSDARASEVTVRPDGTVRGAFVAWITGGVEPLPLGQGWERWVRQEGGLARSPYTALGSAREADVERVAAGPAAGEPDSPERAAELSDLLVFDYLIQNVDRWGTNNTNVRTKGRGGPLLFFDNGAGFWLQIQRLPLMEGRLRPVQRFRRRTIDAVRAFDRAHFEARLARDPLAPLLNAHQLDGLEERCRAVVAHVEAMHARFGDAIWF